MNLYFLFIFLSFLPSILWLVFFLREDKHPEPGKNILKVFFLGMAISIPVIIFSIPISFWVLNSSLSDFIKNLILIVIMAAIIEEAAKYFVIRQSVLKSPECDEPVDIMIYAITVALGFAAMENILFLFPFEIPFCYKGLIAGSFFRFISGTFLHALVAGIMGYFIALSVLRSKRKNLLVLVGITIAMLLHAVYNFSIIISERHELFLIAAPTLLIVLLIIVFLCFKKLKKTPSVCK